jgi:hypothetical protein
VVEDQSRNATRKLVDSDAEPRRLEELIDGAKPPRPRGPEWDSLHYLLYTPFRYPPLRHGSRFGTRFERGIWYGSEEIEAALAESAYYRLRLLSDTAADIRSEILFTAFEVRLRAREAIDLAAPPFARFESEISDKTSYAQSQPLGREMRAAEIAFCRFRSARDPRGGLNLAVFSPSAFVEKTVSDASRENWHCYATRTQVEFRRKSFIDEQRLAFKRADFEVDGRLPTPGL